MWRNVILRVLNPGKRFLPESWLLKVSTTRVYIHGISVLARGKAPRAGGTDQAERVEEGRLHVPCQRYATSIEQRLRIFRKALTRQYPILIRSTCYTGIWLAPKGEDPKLTLIGSTNFGHRSAVRDLEVNVAVQTTSPELRSALRKELVHIQEDAQDEVNDALFARPDRRVGPINRWAAR